MIIYPAIDLRQGRCVRLRQGRKDEETVYGDDPAAVARRWCEQGAEWLHVVNLDGAFGDQKRDDKGLSPNMKALSQIVDAVPIPIQFGGGLRRWEDIEQVLERGVSRVILGTVAVKAPGLLRRALAHYGADRVAVGIDARDGVVLIHGWEQSAGIKALDLAKRMRALGVQSVVYTDVARDGMLTGVNVAATAELAVQTGLHVIASGGVAALDDVKRLGQAEADIAGVIIGRALYTGDVDLACAIQAGKERNPGVG